MVSTLIMNYFELFGIQPSFKPDISKLKKKYYELSFRYHPDHQVNINDSDKDTNLEKSSILNKAYNTLKDKDKLFEYILQLHNCLPEEGKAHIPQEFLMEMMDLNEELMEIELEPEIEKVKRITSQVKEIEEKLYHEIENIIHNYGNESLNKDSLDKLIDFYMKKKYLLRIKQNLLKFAFS